MGPCVRGKIMCIKSKWNLGKLHPVPTISTGYTPLLFGPVTNEWLIILLASFRLRLLLLCCLTLSQIFFHEPSDIISLPAKVWTSEIPVDVAGRDEELDEAENKSYVVWKT